MMDSWSSFTRVCRLLSFYVASSHSHLDGKTVFNYLSFNIADINESVPSITRSISVERNLTLKEPANIILNNDCLMIQSYERHEGDPYKGGMLSIFQYDSFVGFTLSVNVYLQLKEVRPGMICCLANA
jgi:hypothetical protein